MERWRRLSWGAQTVSARPVALWSVRGVIVLSLLLLGARALEIPLQPPQHRSGATAAVRAGSPSGVDAASLPQLDAPPADPALPPLTAKLPAFSPGDAQTALGPLRRSPGGELLGQLPGTRRQAVAPLRVRLTAVRGSVSAPAKPVAGAVPPPVPSSQPTPAAAPSAAPSPSPTIAPTPTASPSHTPAPSPPVSPPPTPGPDQQPPASSPSPIPPASPRF